MFYTQISLKILKNVFYSTIVSCLLGWTLIANAEAGALRTDTNGQHNHDSEKITEAHADEHDDHHSGHPEGRVTISADIAQQSGLEVAKVQSAALEIITQAYGKMVIPPGGRSEVHARFPGIVRQLQLNVGDRIQKGDVLAVVESDDSLEEYTIVAPISGMVTQRPLNLGETTRNEPVAVIVDDSRLWVELTIFPHHRQLVKQGQKAYLARDKREAVTSISHLTPSDNDSHHMLARAVIDNEQRQFIPGELVSADIVVDQASVPLAIDNKALQTLEGQQVVFVKNGDSYKPRPLSLGRTDGTYTEVLSGLSHGETYVTDNSYLIKADLEKAGAGHHH